MTEIGRTADAAPGSEKFDVDRWEHTGPAIPHAATTLRRRVRAWAQGFELAEDVVNAIELGTYEALTNVVEHAYRAGIERGDMTVRAVRDAESVTVTVTDTGVWQPPVPTPDRSHGLSLIEAVSDRLDIDTTDTGTTVTIAWTLPSPASL